MATGTALLAAVRLEIEPEPSAFGGSALVLGLRAADEREEWGVVRGTGAAQSRMS